MAAITAQPRRAVSTRATRLAAMSIRRCSRSGNPTRTTPPTAQRQRVSTPGTAATSTRGHEPPTSPPVRSPHGNLYPPGTEWAVNRLPPFNSNQPVSGVMRLDSGEPIDIKQDSSGRTGVTAVQRVTGWDYRGRDSARWAGHVEMIAGGGRSGNGREDGTRTGTPLFLSGTVRRPVVGGSQGHRTS